MDKGYEVLRIDRQDTFATGRRVWAYLLVPPGTTAAQARHIARQFADDLRRDEDYQALAVGFYDRPELLRVGETLSAPLGRWEHAPNGEWNEAPKAKLGVYSTFQEKDLLREKDWSKRPTDEQLAVLHRCLTLGNQFRTVTDLLEADEVALELVSTETGVSTEGIRRICQAVVSWMKR